MVSFKTYLNEGLGGSRGLDRSKQISMEEAKKTISEKCSQILAYYKQGQYRIYRGVGSIRFGNAQPHLVSPNLYTRESRNTSNYYTVLIDNLLPGWSMFPKRSKSIICSTNAEDASFFGTPSMVFPFDNAKIAFAPNNDFWSSFSALRNISMALSELNSVLLRPLFSIYGEGGDDNITPQTLLNAFNLADRDYASEQTMRAALKNYPYGFNDLMKLKKDKKYLDFLSDLLDPVKNKFTLQQLPKLTLTDKTQEVWTDSNSVLIPQTVLTYPNYDPGETLINEL